MSANGHIRSVDTQPLRLTGSAAGFSLIELMLGMTVLVVGMLGVISMFSSGYSSVAQSGRMTMGFSAAQQLLEDARSVPFNNLPNLNNFNSGNPGSQPGGNPEREVARKWRYALAGDGAGWGYTQSEKDRWTTNASGGTALGATGQITVADATPLLRTVTVTVTMPGRGVPIRLTAVVGRF